ncbi:Ribosomal protein L15 [Elusimicrobium minutum Pei191]|uniref:Large ribosomal subunit protein uL15 n=1 Tax=Elusimicrobium minutum (strain Pei191) TaxID=445932 RepID=RL15_ELUMP|nr:50S ribosomal protein L15 [Elusimicrobium minutum]B2KEK3.1 RecName: Full=Large ribosomal subunit protein uL15; AltName: Full=50S ribosomal protein L15 [Elusimicrobium minutum Pei191]ACC98949.1 Ribosomal protein L15 [Elusimicrobium minutum Pei191]
MVKLNELFPKHGSRKAKRRIGLGVGSGLGRSATKGMKGQSSRSGNTKKESKEGGQMPLYRRVPKSGFSNATFAKRFDYVNIGSLEKACKAGEEVTPETMKTLGLVKCAKRVKVLANGELKKGLKVSAHGFSATAKAAIEKAGGSVTVIEKK